MAHLRHNGEETTLTRGDILHLNDSSEWGATYLVFLRGDTSFTINADDGDPTIPPYNAIELQEALGTPHGNRDREARAALLFEAQCLLIAALLGMKLELLDDHNYRLV